MIINGQHVDNSAPWSAYEDLRAIQYGGKVQLELNGYLVTCVYYPADLSKTQAGWRLRVIRVTKWNQGDHSGQWAIVKWLPWRPENTRSRTIQALDAAWWQLCNELRLRHESWQEP